ncbi:MAG: hypothetical protein IPL49_13790 [Saprospirales bacterium]|nr:hypothetical protein [Saprospirales bacterium]
MIVVADSGSSKTDWVFIGNDGTQQTITSAGFNPVLHRAEEISSELAERFRNLDFLKEVTKVFFYGSGCWDEKRAEVIIQGIQSFFPNARLVIEHDLLGAARATCGEKPGIACILGTGSNSCLYDGRDIVDNVTNLGYLLGDEGSGSHLGKMIIRAYFYRELPPELAKGMQIRFPGGKTDILDKIYGNEKPNLFLASFASWVGDNATHPYIHALVKRSFGKFLDRQVLKYEGHAHLPVHFVGSIAHHFIAPLAECCEERNLHLGKVLSKPVGELVSYHLKDVM